MSIPLGLTYVAATAVVVAASGAHTESWLQFFTAAVVAFGAAMGALTAYYAKQARMVAADAKAAVLETATQVADAKQVVLETKTQVAILKTQTDGLTTALVEASKVGARAEGKEEGRLEGESKAAALAEGKLQAEQQPKVT